MNKAPRTGGVYFLWDDNLDKVIYVGSSENLRQRISQSHKERGGAAYSYIEADDYKELEKQYIYQCNPILNVTYNDTWRYNPEPIYPSHLEKIRFQDEVKVPRTSILLKLRKDHYDELQQIARKTAYEENRNYSTTDLINDILRKYLTEVEQ